VTHIESALILGGLGQVGGLMADCLAGAGVEVTYADLGNRPNWLPSPRYLSADVTAPDTPLLERIAAAACVVVCLPEEAALAAAPRVLEAMPDGAVWIDTLSVKTGICRILCDCRRNVEMLSINPMFAPALGWRGHPVAVVELASGVRSAAFLELLRAQGATVEMLTADAHDALTATIQVATHAVILAFGTLLLDDDYSMEKRMALATPPHRLLLALLSRIVSSNPEIYWDIQRHHPKGDAVRRKLAHTLRSLDESPAQFERLFEQLRARLSPSHDFLKSLGDRIVNEAYQTPGTIK